MHEDELKTRISYEQLRQIIFDYYKETEGIVLHSISIEYFADKLTDGRIHDTNYHQPFFVKYDESGEHRFDIPKERIIEILASFMDKKNLELKDVEFDIDVEVTYDKKKELEQQVVEEQVNENKINSDIPIDNKIEGQVIEDSMNKKDFIQEQETKNESVDKTPTNIISIDEKVTVGNEEKNNSENLSQSNTPELVKLASEDESKITLEKITPPAEVQQPNYPQPIRYEILKRRRAVSDAEIARNRSALLAGAFFLGAGVSLIISKGSLNPSQFGQLLQEEINGLVSWEALATYVKDLGPLTDLLIGGAGAFLGKLLGRDLNRLTHARNDLQDYMASLEDTNSIGGK